MGEVRPDRKQFLQIPWRNSGCGCSAVICGCVEPPATTPTCQNSLLEEASRCFSDYVQNGFTSRNWRLSLLSRFVAARLDATNRCHRVEALSDGPSHLKWATGCQGWEGDLRGSPLSFLSKCRRQSFSRASLK